MNQQTSMNESNIKSPALIHSVNVVLVICCAALALQATWFMRTHHPVVSSHSDAEGVATLLLWSGILVVLIVLPLVGAFRLSRFPFPLALRLVVWSSFLIFLTVIATSDGKSYLLPYAGTVAFFYLFACDVISASRLRSWLIVATSSVGLMISAIGFVILSWAFLYAE